MRWRMRKRKGTRRLANTTTEQRWTSTIEGINDARENSTGNAAASVIWKKIKKGKRNPCGIRKPSRFEMRRQRHAGTSKIRFIGIFIRHLEQASYFHSSRIFNWFEFSHSYLNRNFRFILLRSTQKYSRRIRKSCRTKNQNQIYVSIPQTYRFTLFAINSLNDIKVKWYAKRADAHCTLRFLVLKGLFSPQWEVRYPNTCQQLPRHLRYGEIWKLRQSFRA